MIRRNPSLNANGQNTSNSQNTNASPITVLRPVTVVNPGSNATPSNSSSNSPVVFLLASPGSGNRIQTTPQQQTPNSSRVVFLQIPSSKSSPLSATSTPVSSQTPQRIISVIHNFILFLCYICLFMFSDSIFILSISEWEKTNYYSAKSFA